MKGIVKSSVWHHRQENISDAVKVVHPSGRNKTGEDEVARGFAERPMTYFLTGISPAGGVPLLSRPIRSTGVAGGTSLASGATRVARAQMTISLIVAAS
jgi:hypothetical protein